MDPASLSHLNEGYAFATFAQSDCNRAAVEAARIVTVRTHEPYNPLFIQGGRGTGKTHLLHAIGNAIRAKRPGVIVCYRTAEEFTNGCLKFHRAGGIGEFRNKILNIQVLLMDDVEFLEGKKFTQQEFELSFDLLRDAGKQIVLTSQLPPKRIGSVRAELRRRLSSGQVVSLGPPDVDLKAAILKRATNDAEINIPAESTDYLIRCASTAGDLKAMVVKLKAYTLLDHEQNLSHEKIVSVLQEWGNGKGKPSRLVLSEVGRAVDDRLGHLDDPELADLLVKSIFKNQVILYLARTACGASFSDLGRAAQKHHTTVMHAVSKIASMRQENTELRDFLAEVELVLRAFRR
jgi:chromosomal replication initiator protein